MKAIWTGAIGFGLVYIPVKLYSAIQSGKLDLDMLDQQDHARIHYKRVNAETGKEVPWDAVVKGYLLNDQYIVVEDQDFEAAMPEKNKTIALQSFVHAAEIEQIYFNGSYYLAPQKGGEKAYSLLYEALKKTATVGLGTFVLRSSENVVLVSPYKNLLLVSTLHFQEEIRNPEELGIGQSKLTKAEMDMAIQLIEQHQHPLDLSEYRDEYSKALLSIIQKKAKGQSKGKTAPIKKIKSTTSTQLLNQLRASLR